MIAIQRLILFAPLAAVVSCGGATGSPTAPTNSGTVVLPGNRPPVIESLIATPEFGIADIEVFTFDAKASDPDGDRLTYAWRLELGPGGSATGSGPRASARYTGGVSTTWPVTVIVSDSVGNTAQATVNVAVGSVNGRWRITSGEFTDGELELRQDGAGVVRGQYVLPGAGSVEEFSDGQITLAAAVTLPLRLGSRSMTFSGTMEKTGRQISGIINGNPCVLLVQ
jgi:hypothetical protein